MKRIEREEREHKRLIGLAWTVEVIEVSRRITQEDMAEKPNRTARDPQRASPATVAKRAMRGAPELSTVSLHERRNPARYTHLGLCWPST